MKIALDGRVLEYDCGGIARVTLNMLHVLKQTYEFHVLFNDRQRLLKCLEEDSYIKTHCMGPALGGTSLVWENFSLIKLLKKIKPVIFHAPCNFGIPIFKQRGVKYIVTLHDLLPLYYSGSYKIRALFKWHLGVRIALHKADMVVTGSYYSKEQIHKRFRISENKIRIIPCFIDPIFNVTGVKSAVINKIILKYGIKGEYVMYHGGFKPYKNVKKVLHTFARLKEIYKTDCQLCLVGKQDDSYRKYVAPTIKQEGLQDKVVLSGFVSNQDLADLLKGAKCFIYLSRMEGFGFAPLEAMACGTPVVCSRNTSLPEILGDAAMWVTDIDNPDDIAAKIKTVLSDRELALKQSRAGLEQVQNFREDLYKDRMISLYREVSGMNNS